MICQFDFACRPILSIHTVQILAYSFAYLLMQYKKKRRIQTQTKMFAIRMSAKLFFFSSSTTLQSMYLWDDDDGRVFSDSIFCDNNDQQQFKKSTSFFIDLFVQKVDKNMRHTVIFFVPYPKKKLEKKIRKKICCDVKAQLTSAHLITSVFVFSFFHPSLSTTLALHKTLYLASAFSVY